jgi:tetratricopeptide (TPR) repeat protein
MLDRESLIIRINWSLSVLATYLKLSSGQNLNTPTVLAEDFCVGLLNLLYGYNLSNANATMANAPAVDLVDPYNRLAVQISINDTTEKIRHTHRMATEHNLGDVFERIILLFLVSKAPAEPVPSGNFTPCARPAIEVRDLSTLLADIRGLDVARMTAIADLLDQEIGNPAKPWNRDASLRPANLPYVSLGSLFKGRDDFLTDLHGRLAGHSATLIKGHAIHGLGGVGKTRAAVEYAWRYRSHYTALFFVSADSPETLDAKLAGLCHTDVLNLPAKGLTDQNEQKAAVLTWLYTHPGWLLILDNADTEDALTAVDQLLPRLAGGHVLITSRKTDYAGGIDAVALDVLADADAASFLLERTADHRTLAPDDDVRALELARELGGLALALEQAAAHIRKVRLSFAGYIHLWHTNTAAALHWYNARTMHYPRSLAVTYQTSIDQLSEPAKEFFRVLSWLAPDPIPFVALDGDQAPTDARALLAELENLSLARRDAADSAFTVHRLVQEITRQQQSSQVSPPALIIALGWLDGLIVQEAFDFSTWPKLEPLVPHAHAAALKGLECNIPTPTARLLNLTANLYHTKAQYSVAEPLYRMALALREGILGRNHPDLARVLNDLAQLLLDANRLAEAEPLMHQALAIDEAAFGKNHSIVARDLNNLAQLFGATNRLAEAEPLMRQALAIDEVAFGKDHPETATDLSNLAMLMFLTNRLTEAEPLMRRVLAINEGALGANHPNVAAALNNLARLLLKTNRAGEAEPLMRQALAIDEAAFGTDHPNFVRDLNNLALLFQATNCLAEAEAAMRRALETIAEFSNSMGHPHSYLEVVSGYYRILLKEMGDTETQAEAKINRIVASLHLR